MDPPRGEEHQLVDAVGAFVGEHGGKPTPHGVAYDVGLLQAQGVLELPNEVHEVGEGVLLLKEVAEAPADAVDGKDPQLAGQRADVEGPAMRPARVGYAVNQDGGVAGRPASRYLILQWLSSTNFSSTPGSWMGTGFLRFRLLPWGPERLDSN